MPTYKDAGFDITKIVDEIGEGWAIKSIDGDDFGGVPIPFTAIPTKTTWPNGGELVVADLPGEDGDLWLKQNILDYMMTPPNYITMVIVEDYTEVEHYINSVDFIGGRPPHRPTT